MRGGNTKCPRIHCGHPADKHKTRPGGKTSYCLSCAVEVDRGWRKKESICYLDAEAVIMLVDIDSKERRSAQMAPAS